MTLRRPRSIASRRLLLLLALVLLLTAYPASSGPATYAVRKRWLSGARYHATYTLVDEVVWGTPYHNLLIAYRRWWFDLADSTGGFTGEGGPYDGRYVGVRSRQERRILSRNAPEFWKFARPGDSVIVLIDERVIAISNEAVRVDGKPVLSCRPGASVEIESDDGELTIKVSGQAEPYSE